MLLALSGQIYVYYEIIGVPVWELKTILHNRRRGKGSGNGEGMVHWLYGWTPLNRINVLDLSDQLLCMYVISAFILA